MEDAFNDLQQLWKESNSIRGTMPIIDFHPILTKFKNAVDWNTSAINIVNLTSNDYLYVDESIEKVIGHASVDLIDKKLSYLYSFVPLWHKIGILKSVIHYKRFINGVPIIERNNFIANREFTLKSASGVKHKILHQTLYHFYRQEKLQALIIRFINLDLTKNSDAFSYYIFDKMKKEIVYAQKSEDRSSHEFSKREVEIINMIADGFSSHEIAEKLFISLHTVKTHRKNILKKSKAKNMIELIKKYFN